MVVEWLIFCQAKHILITYEKHWSAEISEKWPRWDDSEVAQCYCPYHTQPFLPPFFTWNTFQVHICAKGEGYKTTDVSCHRPNNILIKLLEIIPTAVVILLWFFMSSLEFMKADLIILHRFSSFSQSASGLLPVFQKSDRSLHIVVHMLTKQVGRC